MKTTKNVRPCHSIHCRHYDLADGMKCEVEHARDQARVPYVDTCIEHAYGTAQRLSFQVRVF